MASSLNSSSQPVPYDGLEPKDCPPDNHRPENSKENLDARRDHAIQETSPTSDPTSVHITAGPAPDHHDQEHRSPSAGDQPAELEQDTADQLLDQGREALLDVTDSVSGAVRGAYDQGSHYVRQAREQYPQAEQYIREGQQAVTRRVTGNPLLAMFTAGLAGRVGLDDPWSTAEYRDPRAGPWPHK